MLILRNYREVRELKEALNDAAANGTLDIEILDEAVLAIDHAGYETIPESIGWPWIKKNHDAFMAVVDDVAEFIRRHLNDEYVYHVLYNAPLLGEVPQDMRTALVRDVLLHSNAGNSYWIRVLVDELDIPAHDLGEIIIEKLAVTSVEPRHYNFVENVFLAYGSGHVGCMRHPAGEFMPGLWRFEERLTLWSVLDEEQFVEALSICAAKCPWVFFDSYTNHELTVTQKLRIRLSDGQFDEILAVASKHLTSLNIVSFELFERLSPENQVALLDRFETIPVILLAELALSRGFTGGGIEPCMRFSKSFANGGDQVVINNYRRLWNKLNAAEDQDMAKVILDFMQAALTKHNIIYGQLKKGTYFNKRAQRQVEQLFIQHHGVRYVQSRNQHRYFPEEGDMVLINTRWVHKPSPSGMIAFAAFIPADGRAIYE